jgi:succinyl-diaminopimelate desuccinylase
MVVNLNHRFPPDRTIEQATARLRALVPPAFAFEVVDQAAPGAVCLDHPDVQRFVRMSGARVAGKQGWTDVARFTALGIPAFNYGPGIPDLCHRADEYCPIGNLGVVYEQLAAFLGGGPA